MAKLSQIIYQGELRTEATHLQSGQVIVSDAPVDNLGKGAAFSPSDLVATALGSCMLTLMGIAANEHQIVLAEIKADVTKIMASNPRRIGAVEITIAIHDTGFSHKEKQILEIAALTCPVARSLSSEIVQNVEFRYLTAWE
jgi:uncharacterized OsmC-like protein